MHWLLELRVWGLGPELPLRPLAKLALSVTIAGFGLVLCAYFTPSRATVSRHAGPVFHLMPGQRFT